MSKVESMAVAAPSTQYLAWLRRERRGHLLVRAAQLAILVVFLVLWEVLPKALIVNPVLTSYPSALWPTFVELLKSTPQQASILTHTWATVLATVLGFTGAMVLGIAVAAALWWWNVLYKVLDPYLVVANAMPKTAFVPIFYIWLGATMSIYGMSLAISVFITILMIYSGFQGIDPNKIKLAQTFGATKGQILTKGRIAGKRADAGGRAQGECRPVAGGCRRRRIPVGKCGPWLSHPVRQPDFQDEHRDDGNHHPGHRLVPDVSRDLLAGGRRDAPPLEHDPEKWIPVFGKDHAPTKG